MDRPLAPPFDAVDPRDQTRARIAALWRRDAIDVLALANWKVSTAGAALAEAVEIAEGEPWPSTDARVAFERHTATIPADWPLADVRLDLDVGADATVVLHSRHGIERHRIARGGSTLAPPTRAFGIQIVAEARDAVASPGTASRPHLGATRLLLTTPDAAAELAQLEAEAEAIAGAAAAPPTAATVEERWASLRTALDALEAGGPDSALGG